MIKVIIAVVVVGIVFALMENARELSRFTRLYRQSYLVCMGKRS